MDFVVVVSFKNATSLSDTQPTVQVDLWVSSSRPKGQLGVRTPRMWPDEQQPEVIAWYLSVFRTNSVGGTWAHSCCKALHTFQFQGAVWKTLQLGGLYQRSPQFFIKTEWMCSEMAVPEVSSSCTDLCGRVTINISASTVFKTSYHDEILTYRNEDLGDEPLVFLLSVFD